MNSNSTNNNLYRSKCHQYSDVIAGSLFAFMAILAALLLFAIFIFLIVQAWPVLLDYQWLSLFKSDGWYPLEGKLGLLPMLWSTLFAGLGALFIALPLGLATAIFGLYFAPQYLANSFNLIINLLAGIPSVVFGLWGLTHLVPLINQWHPPGASLLAAIIVLAVMILPTIALTSRSALMALPDAYCQGAACLGLSRVTLITQILVPASGRGISSGVLLALGRAFGETMAVLMVAGNVVQIPHSLFDPVRVLTANIALEMGYAIGQHRAVLFASGLMLMLLVALTLVLAISIRGHHARA
jgi:phosphate transport system permease protein